MCVVCEVWWCGHAGWCVECVVCEVVVWACGMVYEVVWCVRCGGVGMRGGVFSVRGVQGGGVGMRGGGGVCAMVVCACWVVYEVVGVWGWSGGHAGCCVECVWCARS